MIDYTREIKEVWFDSGEAATRICGDEAHGLKMINEFHGTYDDDWIIKYRKVDGIEVKRHNPRFVSSIIWEKP